MTAGLTQSATFLLTESCSVRDGSLLFWGGPKETRTPEVLMLQRLRRLRQREYCYEEGSARGDFARRHLTAWSSASPFDSSGLQVPRRSLRPGASFAESGCGVMVRQRAGIAAISDVRVRQQHPIQKSFKQGRTRDESTDRSEQGE